MNQRRPDGDIGARAAIQEGRTADKIPGFDPAAAPLETDGESGGATSAGGARPPIGTPQRPPGTTTASAMRPMSGRALPPTGDRPALVVYIALIFAIGAIFLAALWLL